MVGPPTSTRKPRSANASEDVSPRTPPARATATAGSSASARVPLTAARVPLTSAGPSDPPATRSYESTSSRPVVEPPKREPPRPVVETKREPVRAVRQPDPVPTSTGEPSDLAKHFSEFAGTFMLVFTVGCNVLGGSGVWAGVSIASVLMVAIYSLGGISGANFNPAVSFALGMSKAMGGPGMEWPTVYKYGFFQLVGGVAAGILYSVLYGKSFNLEPGSGFGVVNAGICELLYTCVLCFVVLNVAVAKKNATEKGQYYGLAIGYVIVAGAYGAGAVSGGCFNPAVALGIDTASAGMGFGFSLVYMVFELIGAALAVILFKTVRPEDFGERESKFSVFASEFIGTYVLVLTVGLNVLAGSKAGAFSIAASLMSMIYALGDVSGAHFNPAVTLAIFLSGRCPDLTGQKAATYVVSQIAGGICAAMTYLFIYAGGSFPLGPVGRSTWPMVVVAEVFFTFVLCYTVLCVAVSPRTKSSHMFGLAIGSCVTVGGCAIGGISGGSLNPAVSFGISAASALSGAGFKNAVLYSAMEMFGALSAVVAFQYTHDVDVAHTEAKRVY
eukprot:TRINITY_DN531_c0_g3_i1.p1 TRINITY_DN531_c0_g3~~TRINITY_DN531_c0_g3_i1.p1  ORF type:complete len:558 (-),score=91.38 TRINITY_DN531_c0_g3_i1:128-1801(-)